MYFDPRSPQQFFEALLQALPNGWGGMCTQPHGEEDEYEELRLKDLACDARAWGKLLRPWEVTPPGEWILISTEGEDWSPRYYGGRGLVPSVWRHHRSGGGPWWGVSAVPVLARQFC
ncbi:hypothetical protein ABZ252_00045 [Streptomyces sp. NPDC006175]|uniref:hypothetical protein n=1 Tax=Streptomyces sp. NPDC006175 TaxID=3154471 RepID=UPI0033A858C0